MKLGKIWGPNHGTSDKTSLKVHISEKKSYIRTLILCHKHKKNSKNDLG